MNRTRDTTLARRPDDQKRAAAGGTQRRALGDITNAARGAAAGKLDDAKAKAAVASRPVTRSTASKVAAIDISDMDVSFSESPMKPAQTSALPTDKSNDCFIMEVDAVVSPSARVPALPSLHVFTRRRSSPGLLAVEHAGCLEIFFITHFNHCLLFKQSPVKPKKALAFEDIDGERAEEPEECTEYVQSLFSFLRELERDKHFMPDPKYLTTRQKHINASMRAILIDWLVSWQAGASRPQRISTRVAPLSRVKFWNLQYLDDDHSPSPVALRRWRSTGVCRGAWPRSTASRPSASSPTPSS
jgi:hypothetical protein